MHVSVQSPFRPLLPFLLLLLLTAASLPATGSIAVSQRNFQPDTQRALHETGTPGVLKATGLIVSSISILSRPIEGSNAPCKYQPPLSNIGPLLHGSRRELSAIVARQSIAGNGSKSSSAGDEEPSLLSSHYFVDGVWGYIVGLVWLCLGAFILFLWALCKMGKVTVCSSFDIAFDNSDVFCKRVSFDRKDKGGASAPDGSLCWSETQRRCLRHLLWNNAAELPRRKILYVLIHIPQRTLLEEALDLVKQLHKILGFERIGRGEQAAFLV
jgi:hypothetical protein